MTNDSEWSATARRTELGRAIAGARGRRSAGSLANQLGVILPVFERWESGEDDLTYEAGWSLEHALALRPGTLALSGGYVLGSSFEVGRTPLTEYLLSPLAAARDAVTAALLVGLTVQARPIGDDEPPDTWVIRLAY